MRCRGGQDSPVRLVLENAREGIGGRAGVERPSSGQHLEQDTSEGPDVGALVDVTSAGLFRTHVRRRSDNPPLGGATEGAGVRHGWCVSAEEYARFGQSEIEHLGPHVAAGRSGDGRLLQDDVGGFQIAMDDPLFVCGLERLGDLACDGQRLGHSHLTVLQALGERRTFDQFEHQRAVAVRFLEAVNRADVRMVQGGEHLRLTRETGAPFRVGTEV